MTTQEHWEEVADEYGNVYFYNAATQESRWELPAFSSGQQHNTLALATYDPLRTQLDYVNETGWHGQSPSEPASIWSEEAGYEGVGSGHYDYCGTTEWPAGETTTMSAGDSLSGPLILETLDGVAAPVDAGLEGNGAGIGASEREASDTGLAAGKDPGVHGFSAHGQETGNEVEAEDEEAEEEDRSMYTLVAQIFITKCLGRGVKRSMRRLEQMRREAIRAEGEALKKIKAEFNVLHASKSGSGEHLSSLDEPQMGQGKQESEQEDVAMLGGGKQPGLRPRGTKREELIREERINRVRALAAETAPVLVDLDLSSANIRDEGAEIIAPLLKQTPVRKLRLISNGISDTGVLHLSNLFSSTKSIRELYLNGNLIGNEGAECISTSLRGSRVAVLNLANNPIAQRGAKSIAEWLHDPACQLKELYLGGATAPKSVFLKARALAQGQERSIGDTGCGWIASALMSVAGCPLAKLWLVQCGIGASGWAALSSALLANEMLEELNISSNTISDQDAAMLREAVELNDALRTVTCTDCGLAGPALDAVCRATKVRRKAQNMSWALRRSAADRCIQFRLGFLPLAKSRGLRLPKYKSMTDLLGQVCADSDMQQAQYTPHHQFWLPRVEVPQQCPKKTLALLDTWTFDDFDHLFKVDLETLALEDLRVHNETVCGVKQLANQRLHAAEDSMAELEFNMRSTLAEYKEATASSKALAASLAKSFKGDSAVIDKTRAELLRADQEAKQAIVGLGAHRQALSDQANTCIGSSASTGSDKDALLNQGRHDTARLRHEVHIAVAARLELHVQELQHHRDAMQAQLSDMEAQLQQAVSIGQVAFSRAKKRETHLASRMQGLRLRTQEHKDISLAPSARLVARAVEHGRWVEEHLRARLTSQRWECLVPNTCGVLEVDNNLRQAIATAELLAETGTKAQVSAAGPAAVEHLEKCEEEHRLLQRFLGAETFEELGLAPDLVSCLTSFHLPIAKLQGPFLAAAMSRVLLVVQGIEEQRQRQAENARRARAMQLSTVEVSEDAQLEMTAKERLEFLERVFAQAKTAPAGKEGDAARRMVRSLTRSRTMLKEERNRVEARRQTIEQELQSLTPEELEARARKVVFALEEGSDVAQQPGGVFDAFIADYIHSYVRGEDSATDKMLKTVAQHQLEVVEHRVVDEAKYVLPRIRVTKTFPRADKPKDAGDGEGNGGGGIVPWSGTSPKSASHSREGQQTELPPIIPGEGKRSGGGGEPGSDWS